ncbi:MAG TPA: glucans biosynthesis glucosyltransferase MdoH [Polyangiaceae bacterium LLY-WYZ-14_1]|nr:glucans biosynthesis glucosyltransferase MdoH [Polyangiaceae bacterium LLY-WYZ-14_1]
MERLVRWTIPWRRRVIGFLTASGTAILAGAMLWALASQGLTWLEAGMVACFAATLPWQLLGFWNAVVGFALLRMTWDPVGFVSSFDDRRVGPVHAPTAVAIPVRNEEVAPVGARIRTLLAAVDARQPDAPIDVFVLSDSDDPRIIAEEERAMDALRRWDREPSRLHYRRRTDNAGYKAGNVRELVLRRGDDFTFLVVLDADSLMTGDALLRALSLMQRHPRLGLLQTLVVGLPAASGFARLFQFGMRQGMRSYTTGSCWWQGEAGPYWGHNAVLRMDAFRDHGALPVLPGKPPLGGYVLSHDQVEAALLRAGGWEVRVLPLEDGSFEENPPTLVDYLQRDLRWCQGNLQYLRLFPRLPGLRPMGRVQLLLAVWMYAAAPCWMGFIALGAAQAAARDPVAALAIYDHPWVGGALFAVMLSVVFAPKILGVADVLFDPRQRRAYGGTRAVLAAALAELVFSLLLGPIVAFHETLFMGGLLFGRRIRWSGQRRSARGLSLRDAVRVGALPTVFGVALATFLTIEAPVILPYGIPVLAGWILAIPFAWGTSHPAFGAWMARTGLAATPEERTRVAEVEAVRRLSLAPTGARPDLSGFDAGRLHPEAGPAAEGVAGHNAEPVPSA